ncbi:type II toxin-antitoxin system HicB family antitoxin [Acaryochloris marina]|uniref:HicB family protein n=1 Tax=Acaryochloris marina (strain MBIC 11017) TaxID=329726 RepID=A8ZL81_ACAM1|nr:type II toxin-antitoxin system HicB family antitoxin [Acaryochloris marina]ABW31908.1 HicB family protein [Acaryochloris marina MBIC11017]QUY45860.1 type II toxin-antitoxin system HicB family antitoxin [Acaryochloris marina S15]
MDAKYYTYRVIWSQEDEEFVGLCAEFPSLSWLDEDQQSAFAGIVELVKDCIEDLVAQDEPIPTPLSKKQYSGKFMVRIPPEQHRQLAIQAAEQGISLNRLASSKLVSGG